MFGACAARVFSAAYHCVTFFVVDARFVDRFVDRAWQPSSRRFLCRDDGVQRIEADASPAVNHLDRAADQGGSVPMDPAPRAGKLPALRATFQHVAVKSDALLIVTEWRESVCPEFDTIHLDLRQPVDFDERNLYDLDSMMDM